MTILHRSTSALRRFSIGHKHKRTYTQVSHPVHRISEGANAGASESSNSKLRSNTWVFVPTAIALLGLGFSTFSAHQLVVCHSNDVRSGKKP